MIPTLGSIFFDEEFTFLDGGSSPKLFVILGTQDGVSLVVKTTSNGRLYLNDYGCQSVARFPAFFLPQGSCFLSKHTWLCLGEFYEFTCDQLFRDMVSGKIRRMGELSQQLVGEVMDCALGCEDATDHHVSIINGSKK